MDRCAIRLSITNQLNPQLEQVVFTHPLLSAPRTSTRGRSGGATFSQYSFLWTAGSQALVLLLLRAAQHERLHHEGVALISGQAGSLAAALDSALSKKPAWLLDMCGTDSSGSPIATRLLRRTNPERKRPGPVIISLHRGVLSYKDIEVIVDGELVTSTEELERLMNCFETTPVGQGKEHLILSRGVSAPSVTSQVATPTTASTSHNELLAKLRQAFLEEVAGMLESTEIFDRTLLRQKIAEIRSISWSGPLFERSATIVCDTDAHLSGALRLGCLDAPTVQASFEACGGIRVAMPATLAPSLVLFDHLARKKHYSVEACFSFSNAIEIARSLGSDESFNAAVLTLGGAIELLARPEGKDFEALMFLPDITHRILAPSSARSGGAAQLKSGLFGLWSSTPSGPGMMFERLRNRGIIGPKARIEHMESDEIGRLLKAGDPTTRGILWFPFYHLNMWQRDCVAIDYGLEASGRTPQILFVRKDLFSGSTDRSAAVCLDTALRDSWLELKDNEDERERCVDSLLANADYTKWLGRFGGIPIIPSSEKSRASIVS